MWWMATQLDLDSKKEMLSKIYFVNLVIHYFGPVRFEKFGGIWMVLDESGGIGERKTLFRMKKEADQAGFKGTRTGPELCPFKDYFTDDSTF